MEASQYVDSLLRFLWYAKWSFLFIIDMLNFTQLFQHAFQNIGPFILSQPAQGAFLPFRALLILADLVFLDSSDSPEYVSPPEPLYLPIGFDSSSYLC